MTDLTDSVIKCGLCGCGGCNTITYRDAQRAIDVVKDACIEAVEDIHPYATTSNESTSMQEAAIKAIRNVT